MRTFIAAVLGAALAAGTGYAAGHYSHYWGRILPPRSAEETVEDFFNAAWDLDFESAWKYIDATDYHPEDDPRRYFDLSPNDECTHDGEAIQGSRLIGDTWHVDIRQECVKGVVRETTMQVKDIDGTWRIQVPGQAEKSHI